MLDPWWFQAPGWVQEDGRDLQVSTDKPEINDELKQVLDAAPLSPDHALLRERIGRYDTHVPIFPGPARDGNPRSNTTRSWFGAVLMALFDLSPFLNFIEEAAKSKHFKDPIFIGLNSLAEHFHRRGELDRLEDEDLEQEVRSRTETLWACIKAAKDGTNEAGEFSDNFCHVPELLNYLLHRLERARPQQDKANSGDDV